MAIDPLPTWKSTLSALPKVADNSWALNFANWYAARIAAITTSPAALVPTGFVFTFPVATFKSALEALGPTTTSLAGITAFAAAWESALNGTTVVVAPGSFAPPPSPPTILSVVTTTTIVPASIAAGKSKLIELISAPPVADPNDSLFPEKFRDATLLLKITVIGLDSTPSGSGGPFPLTVANIPLV